MITEFAVVDLFAGPGGLAEGFSKFRTSSGKQPFQIRLSIEMDGVAHQTLLLRSFLRQFDDSFPAEYYEFISGKCKEPDWSKIYPSEWKKAREEAICLELGSSEALPELNKALEKIEKKYAGRIIVIGGPPCQAYSVVGRARNSGNAKYKAGKDKRYFLYREFASIISRLRPVAFVMENVKGIFTAKLDGREIFPSILDSLANACGEQSYQLSPINPQRSNRLENKGNNDRQFLVRSEQFGLPQARHRVIVTGIRSDLTGDAASTLRQTIQTTGKAPTVKQLILDLPRLRSGLSPEKNDSEQNWEEAILSEISIVMDACNELPNNLAKKVKGIMCRCSISAGAKSKLRRASNDAPATHEDIPDQLRKWILDPKLEGISNHDTRGHMKSDLGRYLFATAFAEATGRTPKSTDFPLALAPAHKNWKSGKFADRFRVQAWSRTATTITSHISKDGHANIHPDPEQCRSLTVRDAARLQTFPDNYHFKGGRTSQYVQVGNAVPPFLAFKVAVSLWAIVSVLKSEDKAAEQAPRPPKKEHVEPTIPAGV